MIMDLHTHTHHSPDGADESVAQRIERAKALGLRYMAVTDHVEINRYYPAEYYHATPTKVFDYDSEAVFSGSVAEICAEQPTCKGLKLLCGSEIGQIPQDPALAQQLYEDPRLDLVIGSIHELLGMPDFYFLDYTQIPNVEALIAAYFDEVLRLAQTDCYDTLGHLTYALRYLPDRSAYDLSRHSAVIDEIFRTVIAKDKALELNGSRLREAVPFTDPDVSLLKRYYELGGKYLTIGSDAHSSEQLGFKMEQLEQMAKEAGFEALTVFEKHRPVCIPLNGEKEYGHF